MTTTADPASGPAPLEPVVVLGLLNSMAVVIANVETVLASDACADDAEARSLLERALAHARITSDALGHAVRAMPPELAAALDGYWRPDPD